MRHGLIVLGLALALTGCSRTAPGDEPAPKPAGTPETVTFDAAQIEHAGVKWAAVSSTTVADATDLPGRLVVDEDRTARLSPAVRGRVTNVRVNVGDTVARGDALVTLLSEEGSARRADLSKATAELAARDAAWSLAKSARERAERLLAMKAGSAQDLERARAEETAAASARTQAQADVDRARAALSALDVNPETGQIQLTSPIAGTVVAREAVNGAVIEAGAPAYVVSDLSRLWLEFGAPDPIANALKPGQPLQFVVTGSPDPHEARVLRVSGVVDASTRLVTVRASVANTAKTLRPEMFVTVRAGVSAPQAAVTVPDQAIALLDEKPFVFLAEPDGKGGATFRRRAVQPGASAGGRTRIVSGLAAGDVIVTDGAFGVKSAFSRAKMPSGG